MRAPDGNARLAFIVLHNAQEYLAFPAFFASARGRPGGQWFPAAGLAQTSRRLPRALLSAPVRPLLVIAPAFVTESHAVLVAALLGRLRSGTDYCRRHNLPVGISALQPALREQWIRPNAAWQIDRRGDCAAFDLAQQRVLASTLTNSRCLIPPSSSGQSNVTSIAPCVVVHVFQ